MAPILDSAFVVAANLLKVIDKAIPSDELRLEKFKARHPVRFERIKEKAMKAKLRQLRDLHAFMLKTGIAPETLVKYVGGDINTAQALHEMPAK